ncbi:MAG: hypothetical protein IIZ44_06860 [Muribaculaceae bacterium]|nr:hypothetical protein [Muribaculaceae bacterium]
MKQYNIFGGVDEVDEDGNITRFVPCKGCKLAKYPPCPLLIPCCRCQQNCNSRQPCPKRESR